MWLPIRILEAINLIIDNETNIVSESTTSKGRKTSIFWSHTRLPSSNEPEREKNRVLLYCKYCPPDNTYTNTITTNFRTHLQTRHNIVVEKQQNAIFQTSHKDFDQLYNKLSQTGQIQEFTTKVLEKTLDRRMINEALVSLIVIWNFLFSGWTVDRTYFLPYPSFTLYDSNFFQIAPPAPQGAWPHSDALVVRQDRPLLLLPVGGQQLAEFCHNAFQCQVFVLNGRNVLVVRGAITEAQIRSYRPSYINVLFIQSRGIVPRLPCSMYQTQIRASVRRWTRLFSICIRLSDHFGSTYANCKWQDHAARCDIQDGELVEDSDDDHPGGDQVSGPAGGGQQLLVLSVTGDSMDNPIVL